MKLRNLLILGAAYLAGATMSGAAVYAVMDVAPAMLVVSGDCLPPPI